MNKVEKNLRLAITLTLISGAFLMIYLGARITWPLQRELFSGKTVEPLTPGLQIDVAEELD